MPSTFYWDPVSGNDANDGTSFANRKKTLANLSSAVSGDTIRCIASPDPTLVCNGTANWNSATTTFALTENLTRTITNCESNWTASANVTASNGAFTARQGTNVQRLAFASGFTTGKAAYFTLPSTLDLSAHQQISFWIKSSTSSSANTFRLSLCSDSTGDTQVDNFDITFALTANTWMPVTVNKGSALGNSINSVALYCQADPGTPNVDLDNIFSTTASSDATSLHLNCLIARGASGSVLSTETWWALRSIDCDGSSGTNLVFDTFIGTTVSTNRGYYANPISANGFDLLKRETLFVTATQNVPSSGVTVSGGWDRTNMSTQTGESWLDFRGITANFSTNGKNTLTIEKIASVRSNSTQAYNIDGTGSTINVLGANNSGGAGISIGSSVTGLTLTVGGCVANNNGGISCQATELTANNIYNVNSNLSTGFAHTGFLTKFFNHTGYLIACNNNGVGFLVNESCNLDQVYTVANNSGSNAPGFQLGGNSPRNNIVNYLNSSSNTGYAVRILNGNCVFRIYELVSGSNTTGLININNTHGNEGYIYKPQNIESTVVGNMPTFSNSRIYLHKQENTTDSHRIYGSGFNIQSETGSDRHTASGMAWKVNVTSTNVTTNSKVRFSVAKFAVNSGSAVTFTGWVKKSHATNISARLVLNREGNESTTATAANNTSYQQLTLNCGTPSNPAVYEVFLEVWSGSSTTDSVFVDDLFISQ